jgi:hypothetical protein
MGRARVCAAKEFAMKITVRKRTYQDGHEVLQVDINVIPAGSKKPERYRINVPQGITSKSGATRWGLEEARRIAVEGPPYQTRRARKERIKQEEKERAQRVPTLAEWSEIYLDYLVGERRKSSTLDTRRTICRVHLVPVLGQRTLRECCTDIEVARLKAHLRNVGPRRTNAVLGQLAHMLKVASGRYDIQLPAITKVKVPRCETVKCFEDDALGRIIAAASKRARWNVLVLLMLDLGCRAGGSLGVDLGCV